MRIIVFILFTLGSLVAFACSADPIIDRIFEFNTNIYSDKKMKEEDWLTAEARSSSLFVAFGGLQALAKNSSAEANQEGGLKSVKVNVLKRDKNSLTAEVVITFQSKKVSTSTEMWSSSDNGQWKMTIDQSSNGSKEFAP